jgi:hypothetical protein
LLETGLAKKALAQTLKTARGKVSDDLKKLNPVPGFLGCFVFFLPLGRLRRPSNFSLRPLLTLSLDVEEELVYLRVRKRLGISSFFSKGPHAALRAINVAGKD